MQKTTNYGFNLPEKDDFYNIEDLNANTQLMDEKLKEIEDGTTTVAKATDADTLDGKHASDFLSITGGTVESSALAPITIKRTGSTGGDAIKFANDDGTLGYLGMSSTGEAMYWDKDLNSKVILHTGNGLPLTGGTLTGNVTIERANNTTFSTKATSFKRDGSIPSSTIYNVINMFDADGNNLGMINNNVSATTGNVATTINSYRNSATKEYNQIGLRFCKDGTHYPYYCYNGTTEYKLLHTGNINQAPTTDSVRTIKGGTTDLTAGSSALATGQIYVFYE